MCLLLLTIGQIVVTADVAIIALLAEVVVADVAEVVTIIFCYSVFVLMECNFSPHFFLNFRLRH